MPPSESSFQPKSFFLLTGCTENKTKLGQHPKDERSLFAARSCFLLCPLEREPVMVNDDAQNRVLCHVDETKSS
jgi:hypothetical protein